MATSDWAALAVAGLGGGTVGAVVKGWLDRGIEERRAEREDRRRNEDRAESRRQQNIEQRREVYGRLLRAAAELVDASAWAAVSYTADASFEVKDKHATKVEAANAAYGDVRSEVDVIAVDDTVMHQAQIFWKKVNETPTEPTGETRAAIEFAHRLRDDELARLREVCRRDLGLSDT